MYKLTPNMRAALAEAALPAMLDPWRYGSSTIAAIKRCGFVQKVVINKASRYVLTDSGRRALEEG